MRHPTFPRDTAVTSPQEQRLSRRELLRRGLAASALGAGGLAAWGVLPSPARAAVHTRARIVVVGAGAGGLAAANRLRAGLDGARITVIDRREQHWYQPGFTLVATGVWDVSRVLDRNGRFMPRDVEWVRAMVAEYDPDNNRVVTDDGRAVDYDYLVVATGLKLDYGAIEGMDTDLLGREGIASVYAGPEAAAASWRVLQEFVRTGGTGVFTRPPGAIKCAGAPLKMTFLTQDRLVQAGTRDRARMIYASAGTSLFSQPDIDTFIRGRFPEIGVEVAERHVLRAIDPGRREAVFEGPDGAVTLDYDVLHVVPPMRAPDALAASPLAWQQGPMAEGGRWLEVDRHSLRHPRYPNVFGIGDINGTPIGKTAASVKAQTPVAVNNLISVIAGHEPVASYNGYTSCPLITGVGRAILVEFDYDLKMVPSLPLIDPYTEHWVAWVLKERFLHGAYDAMLRGQI